MLDWALNLPLMPVLITLISKQFWSVALFLRGNYDGEVILVYCSSHYSVGVLWLSYNVRKLLSNLLPYLRKVSKNYWSRIYVWQTIDVISWNQKYTHQNIKAGRRGGGGGPINYIEKHGRNKLLFKIKKKNLNENVRSYNERSSHPRCPM